VFYEKEAGFQFVLDRIDTTVQARRLGKECRTVERVFLQVGAGFLVGAEEPRMREQMQLLFRAAEAVGQDCCELERIFRLIACQEVLHLVAGTADQLSKNGSRAAGTSHG